MSRRPKEGDRIQRYVHVGTGNYNRATAQIYTDLGLFTANEAIVADASELFNHLTGYSRQTSTARCSWRRRRCAPSLPPSSSEKWRMRGPGAPAASSSRTIRWPTLKSCASCIAPPVAGVRVDAIVRGICCLRPGIPGVSDLIHVRSIVGRFLEHSRIYCFENGGEPEIYIGSADLMERNLDRRVEALCPVFDPEIRHYLRAELLQAYLQDDTRACALREDGRYEPLQDVEAGTLDAQHVLISRGAPGTSQN